MKPILFAVLAMSLTISLMSLTSCSQQAVAGPNGGDVVPIQNGAAKAEVVANSDTDEVMVHTWDNDLKKYQPVDAVPIVVGSGERTVELMPHPLASDPPGRCSRFYGHAEWLHGGKIGRGWLQCCGSQATRHEFAWRNCWSGGREHGGMWSEMGEHRPQGMGGMGHGHGGGD